MSKPPSRPARVRHLRHSGRLPSHAGPADAHQWRVRARPTNPQPKETRFLDNNHLRLLAGCAVFIIEIFGGGGAYPWSEGLVACGDRGLFFLLVGCGLNWLVGQWFVEWRQSGLLLVVL